MPVSPARKRWLDNRRVQLNLDSQKRRDEARKNGLCIQCLQNEATPEFATCEGCRKGNTQRMRDHRGEAQRKGLCRYCHTRPVTCSGMRGRKRLGRVGIRRINSCTPCRRTRRTNSKRRMVLHHLIHGPFMVRHLAEHFRIAHRNMLTWIKKLEHDGFVERWVDEEQQRAWVRLTQKGWRKIRASR